MITIDKQSPECAWPPLMDWCHDNGLNPHLLVQIDIVDEGRVILHEYVTDDDGNKIVRGDELVRRTREVRTPTPPPLNRTLTA